MPKIPKGHVGVVARDMDVLGATVVTQRDGGELVDRHRRHLHAGARENEGSTEGGMDGLLSGKCE